MFGRKALTLLFAVSSSLLVGVLSEKTLSLRTDNKDHEPSADISAGNQQERALQSSYTDYALYRENFEPGTTNWAETFKGNAHVQDYTEGGINGRILRTSYPPASNGSPRLVKRFDLTQAVDQATLSFDIKLHSKFEFVKGGKLHGLGGGTGTTGCDPIDANGWSVRMMWNSDGKPILYIYHQDRDSNCGDVYTVQAPANFAFQRGTWYRIDMQVTMNSSKSASDGRATLYIDGEKLIDVTGLRLTGNNAVDIDSFMFSTFYGGSNASWAPSTKTYIYFDNFTVNRGLHVTGTQATECEIFKEGIYSPSQQVCCAESCGSCGGSGCSGLPGGASSCCTGSVSNNAPSCSSSSAAPCTF